MKKQTAGILSAVLVSAVAVAVGIVPTSADSHGATAPIVFEPLTPRSDFTDDIAMQVRIKLDGRQTNVLNVADPSNTAVGRITVQPGAQFPWHTHPGPVFVNVIQGTLTYVNADDCVERVYPVGTAFVDPGRGNVHTAYNGTDDVTVIIATFFEAPAAGPLTIPTDAPGDCDVEVGSHSH